MQNNLSTSLIIQLRKILNYYKSNTPILHSRFTTKNLLRSDIWENEM